MNYERDADLTIDDVINTLCGLWEQQQDEAAKAEEQAVTGAEEQSPDGVIPETMPELEEPTQDKLPLGGEPDEPEPVVLERPKRGKSKKQEE